jgi:LAS superfamily LD-carboxypeptidase LdcB
MPDRDNGFDPESKLDNLKQPRVLGPVSGISKINSINTREGRAKEEVSESDIRAIVYELSKEHLLNNVASFISRYFGSSQGIIETALKVEANNAENEYESFVQNNDLDDNRRQSLGQFRRIFGDKFRPEVIRLLLTPREFLQGADKLILNTGVVQKFLSEIFTEVSQNKKTEISDYIRKGAPLAQTLESYIQEALNITAAKWGIGNEFSQVYDYLFEEFRKKHIDELIKQYDRFIPTTEEIAQEIEEDQDKNNKTTVTPPPSSAPAAQDQDSSDSKLTPEVEKVDEKGEDEVVDTSDNSNNDLPVANNASANNQQENADVQDTRSGTDKKSQDTQNPGAAGQTEEEIAAKKAADDAQKAKEEAARKQMEKWEWEDYLAKQGVTNDKEFADKYANAEEEKPDKLPGSDEKIVDKDKNYSFNSLQNDRFSQAQKDDKYKKDSKRLEEVDNLRFQSKLNRLDGKDKAANQGEKQANRRERDFIKYNQSGSDRIRGVRDTASSAADKRLDLAAKARNAGDEAGARLLEKKALKSIKLAQSANNALPKENITEDLVSRLVKELVKQIVAFLLPLIPWILIFALVFLTFIISVLEIYCRPIPTIRDTIEAGLALVNPGSTVANGFRSELRARLEDSGLCKAYNPNFCSEISTEPNGSGGTTGGSYDGGSFCFEKAFKGKNELQLWKANEGLKQNNDSKITLAQMKEVVDAGKKAGVSDTTIAWVLALAPTESTFNWEIWNGPKYDCYGIVQFCRSSLGGQTYQRISKIVTGRDVPPEELKKDRPLQMKFAEAEFKDKVSQNCKYARNKGSFYLASYAHLGCVPLGSGDGGTKSSDYGEAAIRNAALFECDKIAAALEPQKQTTVLDQTDTLKLLANLKLENNLVFTDDTSNSAKLVAKNIGYMKDFVVSNFGPIPVEAAGSPGSFTYNGEDKTTLDLIKSGKILDVIRQVQSSRPDFPTQISQKVMAPNALSALNTVASSGKFDAVRISSAFRGGEDNHGSGYVIDIDAVKYKGKLWTHQQANDGNAEAIAAFVELAHAFKDTNILTKIISGGAIVDKIKADSYMSGVNIFQDDKRNPKIAGGIHENHYHLDLRGGGQVNTTSAISVSSSACCGTSGGGSNSSTSEGGETSIEGLCTTASSFISTFTANQGKFEGWVGGRGKRDDVPNRCNNPGNINAASWALKLVDKKFGTGKYKLNQPECVSGPNKHVWFETPEVGMYYYQLFVYNNLSNPKAPYDKAKTIGDWLNIYCPPTDRCDKDYIKNVLAGITINNTPVSGSTSMNDIKSALKCGQATNLITPQSASLNLTSSEITPKPNDFISTTGQFFSNFSGNINVQAASRPTSYNGKNGLSEKHKAFLKEVAKINGDSLFKDAGSDNAEAKAAFAKMSAAYPGGMNIVSGYRGYDAQIPLFFSTDTNNSKIIPDRLIFTDDLVPGSTQYKAVFDAYKGRAEQSAPPGYSEHHTGLTFDINSVSKSEWSSSPALQKLYTWLKTNASKYGFTQSFPESRGTRFEHWHWRYDGTTAGTKLIDSLVLDQNGSKYYGAGNSSTSGSNNTTASTKCVCPPGTTKVATSITNSNINNVLEPENINQVTASGSSDKPMNTMLDQLFGNIAANAQAQKSLDLKAIASDPKNRAHSIIVQTVSDGKFSGYNENQPPATVASTIKSVITVVVIEEELKKKNISVDTVINIPRELEGDNENIAGDITIRKAIELMLSESSNTATNGLVYYFGGGTNPNSNAPKENFTKLMNQYGFSTMEFNRYLNINDGKGIPIEQSALPALKVNKGTAGDVAKATYKVFQDEQKYQIAASSLKIAVDQFNIGEIAKKYGFSDIARKWGGTTQVTATIGVYELKGVKYVIGIYINASQKADGPTRLKNTFEDIFKSLSDGVVVNKATSTSTSANCKPCLPTPTPTTAYSPALKSNKNSFEIAYEQSQNILDTIGFGGIRAEAAGRPNSMSDLTPEHLEFLNKIAKTKGYDKYKDGGRANPDMVTALNAMISASGGKVKVMGAQQATNGYRTPSGSVARFFDPSGSDAIKTVYSSGLSAAQLKTVEANYLARAKHVAPPFWSEHTAGYAVDLGYDGQDILTTKAAETSGYRWMKTEGNAAKFGFVESYPKNYTKGAGWEPWHWRFVGNSTYKLTVPLEQMVVERGDGSAVSTTGSTNCVTSSTTATGSMAKLLEYAKKASEGKKPDGRCLWHVNNYIDAVGFGKLPKPTTRFGLAYQYGEFLIKEGKKYGITNLLDTNPNFSPYDAPPGSIVVVTAGSPGTDHPTAGDIAVADGNGKFYNGGEMAYQGKAAWNGSTGKDNDGSTGKVLGIFVADQ